MLRFYTFPPSGVQYPYLLVNPRNYRVLFERRFKHAILDCGVELFKHNPSLKDYPRGFLERWKWIARQLTEVFGDRLWVTIPDYPDDYNPGQFGDNVEKTLRNIEEFIAVDGVNWLPVIQSRCLDRLSFLESCTRVRELIGSYPRVAVGTVCKTNSLSFIEYCCKMVKRHFPNSHIHAFGLTLKALPKVARSITSWDSLVPECGRRKWRHWLLDKPYAQLYGNLDERRKFFYTYLEHIKTLGIQLEETPTGHFAGG
jgi:hypothetical protein